MRDIGFDFIGTISIQVIYLLKGFEHKKSNMYEAVTSFESFDSFLSIQQKKLKTYLKSQKILFFRQKSYLILYHNQKIGGTTV